MWFYSGKKVFHQKLTRNKTRRIPGSLLLSSIDGGWFSSPYVIKRHPTAEKNNEKRLNLVMLTRKRLSAKQTRERFLPNAEQKISLSRYWRNILWTFSRCFKTWKPSKRIDVRSRSRLLTQSESERKDRKAFKCQICFAFNMPIIVKMFQMCLTRTKRTEAERKKDHMSMLVVK